MLLLRILNAQPTVTNVNLFFSMTKISEKIETDKDERLRSWRNNSVV